MLCRTLQYAGAKIRLFYETKDKLSDFNGFQHPIRPILLLLPRPYPGFSKPYEYTHLDPH